MRSFVVAAAIFVVGWLMTASSQPVTTYEAEMNCFVVTDTKISADVLAADLKGHLLGLRRTTRSGATGNCLQIYNATVKDDLDLGLLGVTKFTASNVTFVGNFESQTTIPQINVTNSQFLGTFDLYLAKVNELAFKSCIFHKLATFHSVEAESISLNNSTFMDSVIFVNMKVRSLLNIYQVKFKDTANFSGATIGELNATRVTTNKPIEIRWGQFGDKWLAEKLSWATAPYDETDRQSRLKQTQSQLRFWYRNFLALDYKSDALEAKYQVIKLNRDKFLTPSRIEWWAASILELPSRYGTRPYRPLWIGLGLILVFAIIYWIYDPFVPQNTNRVRPKKPLGIFSLLFSLDTFFPLIDLTGVRDWGWKVSNRFRWLDLLERTLGLVVGGLAAYSIGSYIF